MADDTQKKFTESARFDPEKAQLKYDSTKNRAVLHIPKSDTNEAYSVILEPDAKGGLHGLFEMHGGAQVYVSVTTPKISKPGVMPCTISYHTVADNGEPAHKHSSPLKVNPLGDRVFVDLANQPPTEKLAFAQVQTDVLPPKPPVPAGPSAHGPGPLIPAIVVGPAPAPVTAFTPSEPRLRALQHAHSIVNTLRNELFVAPGADPRIANEAYNASQKLLKWAEKGTSPNLSPREAAAYMEVLNAAPVDRATAEQLKLMQEQLAPAERAGDLQFDVSKIPADHMARIKLASNNGSTPRLTTAVTPEAAKAALGPASAALTEPAEIIRRFNSTYKAYLDKAKDVPGLRDMLDKAPAQTRALFVDVMQNSGGKSAIEVATGFVADQTNADKTRANTQAAEFAKKVASVPPVGPSVAMMQDVPSPARPPEIKPTIPVAPVPVAPAPDVLTRLPESKYGLNLTQVRRSMGGNMPASARLPQQQVDAFDHEYEKARNKLLQEATAGDVNAQKLLKVIDETKNPVLREIFVRKSIDPLNANGQTGLDDPTPQELKAVRDKLVDDLYDPEKTKKLIADYEESNKPRDDGPRSSGRPERRPSPRGGTPFRGGPTFRGVDGRSQDPRSGDFESAGNSPEYQERLLEGKRRRSGAPPSRNAPDGTRPPAPPPPPPPPADTSEGFDPLATRTQRAVDPNAPQRLRPGSQILLTSGDLFTVRSITPEGVLTITQRKPPINSAGQPVSSPEVTHVINLNPPRDASGNVITGPNGKPPRPPTLGRSWESGIVIEADKRTISIETHGIFEFKDGVLTYAEGPETKNKSHVELNGGIHENAPLKQAQKSLKDIAKAEGRPEPVFAAEPDAPRAARPAPRPPAPVPPTPPPSPPPASPPPPPAPVDAGSPPPPRRPLVDTQITPLSSNERIHQLKPGTSIMLPGGDMMTVLSYDANTKDLKLSFDTAPARAGGSVRTSPPVEMTVNLGSDVSVGRDPSSGIVIDEYRLTTARKNQGVFTLHNGRLVYKEPTRNTGNMAVVSDSAITPEQRLAAVDSANADIRAVHGQDFNPNSSTLSDGHGPPPQHGSTIGDPRSAPVSNGSTVAEPHATPSANPSVNTPAPNSNPAPAQPPRAVVDTPSVNNGVVHELKPGTKIMLPGGDMMTVLGYDAETKKLNLSLDKAPMRVGNGVRVSPLETLTLDLSQDVTVGRDPSSGVVIDEFKLTTARQNQGVFSIQNGKLVYTEPTRNAGNMAVVTDGTITPEQRLAAVDSANADIRAVHGHDFNPNSSTVSDGHAHTPQHGSTIAEPLPKTPVQPEIHPTNAPGAPDGPLPRHAPVEPAPRPATALDKAASKWSNFLVTGLGAVGFGRGTNNMTDRQLVEAGAMQISGVAGVAGEFLPNGISGVKTTRAVGHFAGPLITIAGAELLSHAGQRQSNAALAHDVLMGTTLAYTGYFSTAASAAQAVSTTAEALGAAATSRAAAASAEYLGASAMRVGGPLLILTIADLGAGALMKDGKLGDSAIMSCVDRLEQVAQETKALNNPAIRPGVYMGHSDANGAWQASNLAPAPVEYKGLGKSVSTLYTKDNGYDGVKRPWLDELRTPDTLEWNKGGSPAEKHIPAARLRADLEKAIALSRKALGEIKNDQLYAKVEEDIKTFQQGLVELGHRYAKSDLGRDNEALDTRWSGYEEREEKFRQMVGKYTATVGTRPDMPRADKFVQDLEELRQFRTATKQGKLKDVTTFPSATSTAENPEMITGDWGARMNATVSRRYADQIKFMLDEYKLKGTNAASRMLEENRRIVKELGLDDYSAKLLFIVDEKQLEAALLQYRKADGSKVNMKEELGIPSPTLSTVLTRAAGDGYLKYTPHFKGSEVELTIFKGDVRGAEKAAALATSLAEFGFKEGTHFTRSGESIYLSKDVVRAHLGREAYEQLQNMTPVQEVKGALTIPALQELAEKVKKQGLDSPEAKRLFDELKASPPHETKKMSDAKFAIFADVGHHFLGEPPAGAHSYMKPPGPDGRQPFVVLDTGLDTPNKKKWAELTGVNVHSLSVEQDRGEYRFSTTVSSDWKKRYETWAATPKPEVLSRRAGYLMPMEYSETQIYRNGVATATAEPVRYVGDALLANTLDPKKMNALLTEFEKKAGPQKYEVEALRPVGDAGYQELVLKPKDPNDPSRYTVTVGRMPFSDTYRIVTMSAHGLGGDPVTMYMKGDKYISPGDPKELANLFAYIDDPAVKSSLAPAIVKLRKEMPELLQKHGLAQNTVKPDSLRAQIAHDKDGKPVFESLSFELRQKDGSYKTVSVPYGGSAYDGIDQMTRMRQVILSQASPQAAMQYGMERAGVKNVAFGKDAGGDFITFRDDRKHTRPENGYIPMDCHPYKNHEYKVTGKWVEKDGKTSFVAAKTYAKDDTGSWVEVKPDRKALAERFGADTVKKLPNPELGMFGAGHNGVFPTDEVNAVTPDALVARMVSDDHYSRLSAVVDERAAYNSYGDSLIPTIDASPSDIVRVEGDTATLSVFARVTSSGVGSALTSEFTLERDIPASMLPKDPKDKAQMEEFQRKVNELPPARLVEYVAGRPSRVIDLKTGTIDEYEDGKKVKTTEGAIPLETLKKLTGRKELGDIQFKVGHDGMNFTVALDGNDIKSSFVGGKLSLRHMLAALNDNGFDIYKGARTTPPPPGPAPAHVPDDSHGGVVAPGIGPAPGSALAPAIPPGPGAVPPPGVAPGPGGVGAPEPGPRGMFTISPPTPGQPQQLVPGVGHDGATQHPVHELRHTTTDATLKSALQGPDGPKKIYVVGEMQPDGKMAITKIQVGNGPLVDVNLTLDFSNPVNADKAMARELDNLIRAGRLGAAPAPAMPGPGGEVGAATPSPEDPYAKIRSVVVAAVGGVGLNYQDLGSTLVAPTGANGTAPNAKPRLPQGRDSGNFIA